MSLRPSALFLLLAMTADAAPPVNGIAYTVRSTRTRMGPEVAQFSVVAVDGAGRADMRRAVGDVVERDAIVWNGNSGVALNSQNETWYQLPAVSTFAPASGLLSPNHGVEATIKKVRWELREVAAKAGQRDYAGSLSYSVHMAMAGERVTIHCDATITIATTDTVDRRYWPGRVLPRTGFAPVDEKLATAEASIAGFPVAVSMVAGRQYAGGAKMTESTKTEVLDIREQLVDPAVLQRPAHYRHQEPVYGVPGR